VRRAASDALQDANATGDKIAEQGRVAADDAMKTLTGGKTTKPAAPAKPAAKPAPAPAATPSQAAIAAPKPSEEKAAEPAKPAAPRVRFETSLGGFTVQLNPEKAPVTVKNFLSYVDSGFYSGTIFHRVISSFMIQGGGFNESMAKKPTEAPIQLEAGRGLSNLRGTIAMARTSNPNSATSQFFINVVNNRNLDRLGGGYAVFGEVIEGMDVVDKIRAVPTAPRGMHRDVPVTHVVIKSAKRL
jgi:peptidyl-prolyl cis-trans isomerase A (cyclophilin A)